MRKSLILGALGLSALVVAVTVPAVAALRSDASSPAPASQQASKPAIQEAAVATAIREDPLCGVLQTERVEVSLRDIEKGKAMKRIEKATSSGNCQINLDVALSSPALDPKTVCVIVLEPVPLGPDETMGVAFNAYPEGPPECLQVDIASEVLLSPPQTAVGGGGRSVPASVNFNPWGYSQVRGKIIGADCCTVDMLWSEVRLGWWHDGYNSGWPNWNQTDGVDPWWTKLSAISTGNLGDNQNHQRITHSRTFHSGGFPLGLFLNILGPDVDARTKLEIKGYYNGTASCAFPVRDYYYTDLAWLLYANSLKWKTNVCHYEVYNSPLGPL